MTTHAPSGAVRTVVTSVTASTLAAMPSLLLGGLAILVSAELDFGALQLGVAIAVFFAVSGSLSVPAAMLSEAVGPRRAMVIGAGITMFALLGIGTLTPSWGVLLGWMATSGVGMTLTQVAANHLLVQQVRPGHHGVAYGINQAALPAASMMAGLALPVLGLTIGWRITYVTVALGVIPVLFLLRRLHQGERKRRRGPRTGDSPLLALTLLSLGAGFGTLASSGLTTFTVVSAVEHGFATGAAGLLLTAGSLFGISARILSGWVADRAGRGSLLLASGMLGAGVAGYLGLAVVGSDWMVVLATVVAFAGGWGWPGLVLLATARSNPRAPATAMAITRVGPSFGNIVGPILFGAIADGAGFPLAWLTSAAAALVACAFILVARGRLNQHRSLHETQ